MKSGRVDRIIQILIKLQPGNTYQIKDLAKIFNVSNRTVFRDLENIQKAGIKCFYDKKTHSYKIDTIFLTSVANLTIPEALGLFLLIRNAEKYFYCPFASSIQKASLKIESNLLPEIKKYCSAVLEHISVKSNFFQKSKSFDEIFALLLGAIIKKQEVAILYSSLDNSKPPIDNFAPYHLMLSSNNWYVIGKSAETKNFKTYNLARITEVKKLKTYFTRDKKSDVDSYIAKQFRN